MPSKMVRWLHDYMLTWLHGYMLTWLQGYMVTWLQGYNMLHDDMFEADIGIRSVR